MERLPPVDDPREEVRQPLELDGVSSSGRDSSRRRPSPLAIGGEGGRAPVVASLRWTPSQPFQNQPGELGLNEEELQLAFPVHIAANGIWLATAGVKRVELVSSTQLPDSGFALHTRLWDIQFGMMHFRDLGDGWRTGAIARFGSPSDQPFDDLRDTTLMLLTFLNVPANDRDAWNFSLFYSPTSQIVFPIPGVAYAWRPNDRFQANIGVPFSFEYRPDDTWTFTGSYRPLTNVEVTARKAFGDMTSLYASYRTTSDTYWFSERTNDRERAYFFDQRVTIGLQRRLAWGWSIDLSAAHVFDRAIFQAEKFSGTRRDLLEIEPGLSGMLQLQWTR
jgi:hypothetical protein